MIRYTPDQLECDYDSFTDVLYVSFAQARSVIGNETPQGFIVLRSRPEGQVVGVTILDYAATYGVGHHEVTIDAPTPFVVEVGPVDCGLVAFG